MWGGVTRLERAKPTVEGVLQAGASLKGTHEAVKDAIEQSRGAEAERARVREAQAGTKAWLESATASAAALRGELVAVAEMKPTAELGGGEAERAAQPVTEIEAGRPEVEDLD